MIPDTIRALLEQRIASFEALQVLLLLHREPRREWRGQDLAAEMNLPADVAEGALQQLVSGSLVVATAPAARGPYRYAPLEAADVPLVDELSRAWSDQPLTIIRILNANSIARTRMQAIRAFADAFILSRGKRDD